MNQLEIDDRLPMDLALKWVRTYGDETWRRIQLFSADQNIEHKLKDLEIGTFPRANTAVL